MQLEEQALPVSRENLFTFVRALMGVSATPAGDQAALPGPWDSIVRAALLQVGIFGPQPEPWKVIFSSILSRHPELYDVIGGGHSFADDVGLNPQQLPPRFAFLKAVAQTVVGRARLFQEVADATSGAGERQGIIVIGGYLSRFSDDWCGNGFTLVFPFPGPRPRWFTGELDGIDLMIMATQFEQAAKETFSPNLRRSLVEAGAKFAEAGLSKIQ
jgi:hypothetical protein